MSVIDYIKYLWKEITYGVTTIIYLFYLAELNRRLFSQSFSSDFELLAFENYAPLVYFAIALGLFGIGILLIGHNWKSIKYAEHSFGEIIAAFIAILLIAFLLVLLIVFIDNPILRTVMSVMLMGAAVTWAMSC